MYAELLVSYSHYASILLLVSALVVEYQLLRQELSYDIVKRLTQTDAVYGVASVLLFVTGGLRLVYFAKGYEFYFSSSFFWAKITLFAIVGLLSIKPTVLFLKWKKRYKKDTNIEIDAASQAQMLRIVRAEILLVFMIPLFAVAMARGW